MVEVAIKNPLSELNTYPQIQYVLPAYPRQVRLETSSFCSNHCTFCSAHGDFKPLLRKKGKMSWEMYQAAIDDIAGWETPLHELVPNNFGEIPLHKDWVKMLHYCSEKLPRTRIHVVTTGTLFTPERLELLAQVPTLKYVNFSINAFFVETWTRILGVPEKYMRVAVNAVHILRDRRPDVEVNVSMVHDPDRITEAEKDLFKTYWSQFGPVSVSTVSFAGNPGHVPDPPVTLSCRSIFDGLVVFDQGDVGTGCCFSGDAEKELLIGRFPEESLMEIWRGDKLRALAKLHNDGRRAELGFCKTCTFA